MGSALCFIAYGIEERDNTDNLALGSVLIAVVIMNAAFSYWQDSKAEAV